MQSSFLTDLLSTITNRALVAPTSEDRRPIEDLCRVLLSDTGDVSTIKVARAILQKYRAMKEAEKRAFFLFLATEFDIDPQAVERLARRYGDSRDIKDLSALIAAAEPRRQEMFRRLNRVVGATADLVAMRCDLFAAMAEAPDAARIDLDFAHLFSSWFNPGFLVLRRINWQTPANILEKIIAYEAVHAINSWDQLRSRLLPEDRRCFAYFHPCMPDEPLIFVEVALTKGIPGAIQPILAEDRSAIPAEQTDTAVFYSISNCQAGLRGVSFGNSLIKQVVEDLSVSLPQLTTFVTLSPIPGFRAWADRQLAEMAAPDADKLRDALQAAAAQGTRPLSDTGTAETLRKLVAHYLVNEKRDDGMPADSVARFHLGNGAIIHDVHAGADISQNGLGHSYGAMVNYLYALDQLEPNIEAYSTSGTVARSRKIGSLLRGFTLASSGRG